MKTGNLIAVTATAVIRRAVHKKSEAEYGEDFALDFARPLENELGQPAIVLTMNLKALARVANLTATGRLDEELRNALKKEKKNHE